MNFEQTQTSTFLARENTTKLHFLGLAREMGVSIESLHLGEQVASLTQPQLLKLSQPISEYIEAPTIVFPAQTTHPERRAFSEGLGVKDPTTRLWYETNRLRYNHIYGLSYLPLAFESILAQLPEVARLLDVVIRDIPRTAELYERLTIPERVKISQKLVVGLKQVFAEIQRADLILRNA